MTRLLCALLLIVVVYPLRAAEIEPSPTTPVGNYIAPVNAGRQAVAVYSDTTPDSKSVVFFPVFDFSPLDEKNDITSDAKVAGHKIISVSLNLNSDPLKKEIARKVHEVDNPALKTITPGQLKQAIIIHLHITDVTPGASVKFDTVDRINPGNSVERLSISVPETEVKAVCDEIRNGTRMFDIDFTVWARAATATSSATVSYDWTRSLGEYRDIIGDVTTNGWRATLVTRRQKLAIVDRVTRGVTMEYNVDTSDPSAEAKLSADVARFMDNVFKATTLTVGDDGGWNRLSSKGFSDKDTTPATVREFFQKAHSDADSHTNTETTVGIAGAVGYAGVETASNWTYDGKAEAKNHECHDLEVNVKGDWAIPVGLKVYAVDDSAMSDTGKLFVTDVKSRSVAFTKSTRLSTAPFVPEKVAPAELKHWRITFTPIEVRKDREPTGTCFFYFRTGMNGNWSNRDHFAIANTTYNLQSLKDGIQQVLIDKNAANHSVTIKGEIEAQGFGPAPVQFSTSIDVGDPKSAEEKILDMDMPGFPNYGYRLKYRIDREEVE